jgi:hypothetical protein
LQNKLIINIAKESIRPKWQESTLRIATETYGQYCKRGQETNMQKKFDENCKSGASKAEHF